MSEARAHCNGDAASEVDCDWGVVEGRSGGARRRATSAAGGNEWSVHAAMRSDWSRLICASVGACETIEMVLAGIAIGAVSTVYPD
jgi:hypothetical protein